MVEDISAEEIISSLENDSDLAIKSEFKSNNSSCMMWPVKLEGVEDPSLHVTAKYFGSEPLLIEEVEDALLGLDHRIPSNDEFSWAPIVFDTKNDGLVPVLELTTYPKMFSELHQRMEKFKVDDYPSYRPHITVSEEVWNLVSTQGLTPKDLGLSFGDLFINMMNGKTYEFLDGMNKASEVDKSGETGEPEIDSSDELEDEDEVESPEDIRGNEDMNIADTVIDGLNKIQSKSKPKQENVSVTGVESIVAGTKKVVQV